MDRLKTLDSSITVPFDRGVELGNQRASCLDWMHEALAMGGVGGSARASRAKQVSGEQQARATAVGSRLTRPLALSLRIVVLFVVLFACQGSTPGDDTDRSAPLELGIRKQLLLDDSLIESKEGFETTLNPATRTDQAVLQPEMPWEKYGCTVSTVMVHHSVYKLWYRATGEDGVGRLCYATSDDAIHWSRPTLGLVDYKGRQDNNIVFEHDGTVFVDPTDTPPRRFKLIGGWGKYAHSSVNDGGARFRYSPNRPAAWHN